MMNSHPASTATCVGMFASSPPSTSSIESLLTAVYITGTVELARRHSARLPSRSTTLRPLSRSVATARNGMPRLSKLSEWYMPCRVSSLRRLVRRCPLETACGSTGCSPSKRRVRMERSETDFWSTESALRSASSLRRRAEPQSMPRMAFSSRRAL